MVNGQYDQWIRPISDRTEGEISEEEQMFADGSYPQILDIISIKLLKLLCININIKQKIISLIIRFIGEKRGRNMDNLEQTKDEPSKLWLNGYSSSNGEMIEFQKMKLLN